ncbi:MAG: DUF11 domain-containing protein, partial [Acidimicrobiales bacterium]
VSTLATLTAAAGDRLSCQMGSSITCSVNATAVRSTADTFNATAKFTGFAVYDGAAIPLARFDDVLVTTPPSGPDLQIAITSATDPGSAGGWVSWTTTVRNAGTVPATGVTLSGAIPAGVTGWATNTSAGACTVGGTTWSCSLGTLPVGTTVTGTHSGTAPNANTTLTITANAAMVEPDADPSSNTASYAIAVRTTSLAGLLAVDGFSRPDSTILGTAETGQPWSVWSGNFGVTSGAAAPGLTGGLAVMDPGWTYGTYQVRIAAGAVDGFSVVFRAADAANTYRFGKDASGYYRLWKVIGGVTQPLNVQIVRADVVPSDGDVIRITTRPDDGIFVTVNGQHIIDAGDQDLLTVFRFGLSATTPLVRFDDVHISQVISSGMTTIDAFSGGDISSLTSPTSGTRYGWHSGPGWEIVSERAVITSAGSGVSWIDTNDELANVSLNVLTGAAESWVLFRYSETGDHYRFGRRAGGAYGLEVVRAGLAGPVAGATQQIAGLTARDNDVVEVRQFTDGRIQCLVNGAVVVSLVDTVFNVRTTAYGLAGGTGLAVDNFTVRGQ